MDHHHADESALARAQEGWQAFTRWTAVSAIAGALLVSLVVAIIVF